MREETSGCDWGGGLRDRGSQMRKRFEAASRDPLRRPLAALETAGCWLKNTWKTGITSRYRRGKEYGL